MQQVKFPIELIIAEDCSTDGTRAICQRYAEEYPELIRLITSDSNVGAIANERRAMLAARGKYIAFCEGDDYWTDPLKLQKQVQNERQDTTKSFVSKAIDYVKEHYADTDLGIETICGYLNVSAAYFSTVFKKETGKTFINYLTDYRMEEAVELLLTQNEKTYVIAEKVGYTDPNYFSYVFKKQFGMSPSKYKTSRMEATQDA